MSDEMGVNWYTWISMSRLVCVLACLAGVSMGQGKRVQPFTSAPTRIVSRRYGFSMETPPGWRTARAEPERLPLFINFPWEELQGKTGVNYLPKGGAMIAVQSEDGLPEPNGSYSLNEWADFDERSASSETISTRNFEMPASTGVDKAMAAAFDEPEESPDIQQQHDLNVYWQFHGKRFATRLTYVVGDPNGRDFEKTLESLMRSVRPTISAAGRKLP
jgi:hypothetical protein